MNKLSAVIITYNEEATIARCIHSLLSVVDEIVVSDSLSTDETVSIAKSLGAKVIIRPFVGYGATKNFANYTTLNDWVLSIDADEALDETLASEILQLKKQFAEQTVYEVQRLNNYCGKWVRYGGWYPDKKIRLFNKQDISWNLAEVHETLEIPKHYKKITLQGSLLHYSYTTIKDHYLKIDKYSTRGALEAFKNGKQASVTKIYISPLFRFIRNYFIKLGCLDGKTGFIIARLTAREVYLKYKKLQALKN
jgi:glycosyltransferase involved in cell wall biosynthesis